MTTRPPLFFRPAVRGLALLGLALLLTRPLAAAAETVAEFLKQPAPAADPVIARVNAIEIHRSDLLTALGTMPPQVQQMQMPQIYPLLIDRMVDMKLISQAGRAAGLAQDPAVRRRVTEAEDRAIQEVYLESKVRGQVSDDLVRKKYQQEIAENPPEEEVRARHILVANEADAKAIIAQLQKGGDFAALAKSKSTDGTAREGGDLGFFGKGDMVEPFANAAFAMKPGEISKVPVKTQFGYHIIKLEERRKQPAPSFEESKDEIAGEIQQELMAQMVKDLRASAKLERFDLTGKPLPAGAAPAAAPPAAPVPAKP